MSPSKAAGAGAAGAGAAGAGAPSAAQAAKGSRKAPRPPKDWQREEAGTYRSADGRFTLEGDGTGRWFVRDEQQTDDLGLPRTIGPYPTLAAAKDAAVRHREDAPQASPLAERLAAARDGKRTTGDAARQDGEKHDAGRRKAAPAATAETAASPPPTPSWLDELEATDRNGAQRARRLIHDLDALGLEDADGLVRRDILGNQPEVPRRLLVEALRRAMATDLQPDRLVAAARDAGVDPAAAEALASHVAASTLAAAVEVFAARDRLPGAPARLPGWELVERGGARRRIRLTPDDLT